MEKHLRLKRVPPFPVYGSSGEVGSHEKALGSSGIVVGRKGNVVAHWVNTDFYPIDTVHLFLPKREAMITLTKCAIINTDVAVPWLNRDMAYSREILVPDDKNYQRFLSEVEAIR